MDRAQASDIRQACCAVLVVPHLMKIAPLSQYRLLSVSEVIILSPTRIIAATICVHNHTSVLKDRRNGWIVVESWSVEDCN